MIKVVATKASRMYNKRLAEFGRIVNEGEVFEVTEDRFKVLSGENKYGLVLVRKYSGDNAIAPNVITEKKESIKPIIDESPEIYVIKPGESPVKVDEDLKPIKKKPQPKKKKVDKKNEG